MSDTATVATPALAQTTSQPAGGPFVRHSEPGKTRIYDLTGKLVFHALRDRASSPASLAPFSYVVNWPLTSASGKQVSPGVYYIYIGSLNNAGQETRKDKRELFVVP